MGRGNRVAGSARPTARLTEKRVQSCRLLYRDGYSVRTIAHYYGHGVTVVWKAIVGETWRHVRVPAPVPRSYKPTVKRRGEALPPRCAGLGDVASKEIQRDPPAHDVEATPRASHESRPRPAPGTSHTGARPSSLQRLASTAGIAATQNVSTMASARVNDEGLVPAKKADKNAAT